MKLRLGRNILNKADEQVDGKVCKAELVMKKSQFRQGSRNWSNAKEKVK